MVTSSVQNNKIAVQVLKLRAEGTTIKQISETLGISINEVVVAIQQQPQPTRKRTYAKKSNTRKKGLNKKDFGRVTEILEQLKVDALELKLRPSSLLSTLQRMLRKQELLESQVDEAIFLLTQKEAPRSICKKFAWSSEKLKKELWGRNLLLEDLYQGPQKSSPYYGVTSLQIEYEDSMIRYYAYHAGLSVAEYLSFKKMVGQDRMRRLRSIMINTEKYAARSKSFSGDPLCQVSVKELFWFLVCEMQKRFPYPTPLEAFDALTRKSGLVLTKKDRSKAFTLSNIELIPTTKFGERLGKENGYGKQHSVEGKG